MKKLQIKEERKIKQRKALKLAIEQSHRSKIEAQCRRYPNVLKRARKPNLKAKHPRISSPPKTNPKTINKNRKYAQKCNEIE